MLTALLPAIARLILVTALHRRADDGLDIVMLQNLNYDKELEILLRRAKSPSSVELMNNNGVWCAVPFSWKDGVVTIPSDWPCYGVKLLRIK